MSFTTVVGTHAALAMVMVALSAATLSCHLSCMLQFHYPKHRNIDIVLINGVKKCGLAVFFIILNDWS